MKIVPIDLTHQTFKRKVMGFDPDEVSEYLHLVAQEFEATISERNKLKEALRDKELQLMEHKDRERVLKDTITTASQMSDRIKGDAQREANIILSEAQHKADMIVRDARDSLKLTYKEITELKKMKIQFESQMRGLIEAYKGVLDNKEMYMNKINPEKHSIEKAEGFEQRNIHNIDIK